MPNLVNDLNEKMSSKTTNLIKQIDKSLSEANSTINRNFKSLKDKIDNLEDSNIEAIQSAINSVNFDKIEKAINSQIAKQQKKLSSYISTLDSSIDSINKSSKNLDEVQDDINSAISDFNKASKSLTFWKIVAVLLTGAFFGAFAMLGYGLQIAKPLIFADSIKTQKKYKEMMKNATGVVKFFDKNNIHYAFGYFTDTKEPYFFLKGRNYKNSWKDKQGNLIIQLKK